MIFQSDDARLARLQHLDLSTRSQAHFLEPRHERLLAADLQHATGFTGSQQIEWDHIVHAKSPLRVETNEFTKPNGIETKSQQSFSL